MGWARLVRLYGIAAAFMALAAGGAQAAPQILGLVASVQPTPLTCANGVCAAEFTTFCLQEYRQVPKPGTVYAPSAASEITLTVAAPDGAVRRAAVGAKVSVTAVRDFSAVRIAIPEAAITALGAGAWAALSVGPLAAVVPVPLAGDGDPQSAAEIADYLGPLRQGAEIALAAKAEFVTEARLTGRMINALPRDRETGPAARHRLWRQVLGPAPPAGAGAARAKAAFDDCKRIINKRLLPGMRACLAGYHGEAMVEVTKGVWNRLRPGS